MYQLYVLTVILSKNIYLKHFDKNPIDEKNAYDMKINELGFELLNKISTFAALLTRDYKKLV
ncbi:hypothetical protein PW52_01180 [Tamlana sedimentorum]|uniref:Uncharacterized protein n=1 Tax=Neotamlana sedimentorum TaxID=1435349 RepID=A0A0D7WDA8_9FLAO|nr:hypothetical protein PW52_01180 [Tamlana sedimentorum]